MSTRSEHMNWCKSRALAYLPNDPQGAIASMLSDLGKNPETANHGAIRLTMMLMLSGLLSTADDVRKHIEGFN
jgi:hypothetical protein